MRLVTPPVIPHKYVIHMFYNPVNKHVTFSEKTTVGGHVGIMLRSRKIVLFAGEFIKNGRFPIIKILESLALPFCLSRSLPRPSCPSPSPAIIADAAGASRELINRRVWDAK